MMFEKLGDIATIKTGKYDVNHSTPDGEYVFYTCAFGQFKSPTYSFEGPAIILPGNGANVGEVFYYDGKFEAYQRTYVVQNFKADPNYIYAYFKAQWKNSLRNKQFGSATNYIRLNNLTDFKIPLPPLPDQLHIANLLSKAENLIAQRKESIRLLDEFLKSTFLEMFGDPSSNRKQFPKGSIRDVVAEVKYGTSSPAEDEGLYPYLRMNNITPDGYMDYSKLKYINIVDEKEKEKYVVRKGDLLFNRTNSKELVGKTGVFNEDSEMIIAGYLIRVRTNEKANPWFLWGYLNSIHGKQTLLGMCKSIVGMANINAQELQGIKILIPQIELQTQFAQIVKKTEALKTQYQQSLQELENLYGSLSRKAFRGELGVKEMA
ncbi:MAG TPA: restriction endonuclease subunit S [bacterium]|nr:restriction endonuclease subunit S [bacterium]HNE03141.1 restriction endonuclease subunit S [Anaerolineales bacterium]HMZ05062.1 restriction endonuclease subunit S [bacterium]HND77981.1 restriction endonuclease subunit S [bacterium]HNH33157.1 restriction endonuclease subunit S [bacterium]